MNRQFGTPDSASLDGVVRVGFSILKPPSLRVIMVLSKEAYVEREPGGRSAQLEREVLS